MLRTRMLAAILFCLSLPSVAQTDSIRIWTLEECIAYAEEHGIDIQKQILALCESNLTLQESRWAFVPSLSASSNYTVSTGRVLDPTTYQFVETNLTSNTSSSLSGSISIFEGGKKLLALNKAKLSFRYALLKDESIKNSLKLNVIAAYMDVLCAREQISIATESASLVDEQLKRSRDLFEAGSITESEVLQLKSQLFAAENDVTTAQHSRLTAIINLCDLLEIENYESIDVSEPAFIEECYNFSDVESYVDKHPDYQLSILNEHLSEADSKIAKAGLYPTLSLTAGYGSSYSDARQKTIVNPDGTVRYETYPFIQQYADNASAYVAVGLKIPIVNGLSARNTAKRAEIAINEARLSTIETRKRLRKQIIEAQVDCDAARDKYLRAVEEMSYAREAQRQVSEKYNLGATDFLTWNSATTELAKAGYSLVEAKYFYVLKCEILKSYYRMDN